MQRRDGSLIVRPPAEGDAPHIAASVQASLAELRVWMPWATDDYDEAVALQWIRGEFDPAARLLIAQDDGSHVGSVGFHNIDQQHECGELGYWIHSDHAGHGLGPRAARLACEIGFSELALHRIEMLILPQNPRSIRVAEKLGATFEGTRRGRIKTADGHLDANVYVLLATDVLATDVRATDAAGAAR